MRVESSVIQHSAAEDRVYIHEKTASEIIRFVVPGLLLTVVNLLAFRDPGDGTDFPNGAFLRVECFLPALTHFVPRDELLHIHQLLSFSQYTLLHSKLQQPI